MDLITGIQLVGHFLKAANEGVKLVSSVSNNKDKNNENPNINSLVEEIQKDIEKKKDYKNYRIASYIVSFVGVCFSIYFFIKKYVSFEITIGIAIVLLIVIIIVSYYLYIANNKNAQSTYLFLLDDYYFIKYFYDAYQQSLKVSADGLITYDIDFLNNNAEKAATIISKSDKTPFELIIPNSDKDALNYERVLKTKICERFNEYLTKTAFDLKQSQYNYYYKNIYFSKYCNFYEH